VWLTTPVPSAVMTSFGREDVGFAWKVLRFWDVRDLDSRDHPRSRGTSLFRGQDSDSPDERVRLAGDHHAPGIACVDAVAIVDVHVEVRHRGRRDSGVVSNDVH
jgi:hypothetical protein